MANKSNKINKRGQVRLFSHANPLLAHGIGACAIVNAHAALELSIDAARSTIQRFEIWGRGDHGSMCRK